VIVECDQCQAKYHYDEARFAGKPSKKLRCSKCRAIFEIFNTHAYEVQPPLRPPIADGTTMTRRSAEMFPERIVRPEPSRERRRSAGPLKLPLESKLSLAVIAGPDAGKMFAIDTPRIVIGREEVDLALDDPEISRHHAAIEVRGEDILLLDLGSTNGTFVKDEAISQAPLENQSEFTIGGSTLMLIVTNS
jgi:predicted Zn finger-like uncharacterized protein